MTVLVPVDPDEIAQLRRVVLAAHATVFNAASVGDAMNALGQLDDAAELLNDLDDRRIEAEEHPTLWTAVPQ